MSAKIILRWCETCRHWTTQDMMFNLTFKCVYCGTINEGQRRW